MTKVTLSGNPPDPTYDGSGAPAPIDPATGMHKDYWVLSAEERAKGFVRPVRTTYRHVGIRPVHPLRDLTEDEKKSYASEQYVKFEVYPKDSAEAKGSITGRFWTERDLKSGCGMTTSMGTALSETYARQPSFYGATFCAHCRTHYPVGADGEFVWVPDQEKVGT